MFTEITTLNGGIQLVQTSMIIRFRPSFGSFEPTNAAVIDYADQRLFSSDSAESIAEKIGDSLPIAALTTPNGLALFVDAAKVVDIAEPTPGHHHSRARSIVRLSGRHPTIRAQLRETPSQARRKIEQATG